MKKLLITLNILILFFAYPVSSYCTGLDATDSAYNSHSSNTIESKVYSPSVILVEKVGGHILFEKNAREKMYPASTTKILTAIIVLENCNLSDKVTVKESAVSSVPPSYVKAHLEPGEEFTVLELLHVLLIPSANDAANVLAEHVSGSVSSFADLMNETAKKLGLGNSNFTNPSGIHDENLYTTAYDLSILARHAMNIEAFRKIVSKTNCSLPATSIHPAKDRNFSTTNMLIVPSQKDYYYPYCIGGKTGFTDEAGNCLVTAASKDDVEFIAVCLHGGTLDSGLSERFLDCKTLFDFAFDNYTTYYKDLQVNLENLLNKSDGPESSLTSDKTYGSKDYDFLDLCLKIGCVIIVLFAFKLLFSRKKRNKRKRTRH